MVNNVNQKLQNRRINSEEKLKNYIRTMLGEPVVSVDVSDDQIYLIIDDCIKKYSDFAYGGEQEIVFFINGKNGIKDYVLDYRIQTILGISIADDLGFSNSKNFGMFGNIGINYSPFISKTGEISTLPDSNSSISGVAGGVVGNSGYSAYINGYVLKANADSLNSLNTKTVNYEFNANTKILRVFEDVNETFLVNATIEYIPNPDYDEIYSNSWIKEYCVAKTKFLWGTVTGKYSQSLIGGAEINYADMKSEAEAEINKLEEDLLNKYSEPLGIFSG